MLGYAGLYQISNYGRVKSLVTNEKIMKQHLNPAGYMAVTFATHKAKFRIRRVHRLVLIHFKARPPGKFICNHIDANKQNNHIDNLEWSTPLENIRHAKALNRLRYGETHGRSKLTNVQAREIKYKLIPDGVDYKEIAKMYGVSTPSIYNIAAGNNWAWL